MRAKSAGGHGDAHGQFRGDTLGGENSRGCAEGGDEGKST
jgi:hypothetical protein